MDKKGKFNIKKIVKIIGNIIMLAALFFIVKKVISMDIDFTQFRSPKVAAALVMSTLIQTVIWIFACFPWLVFTQSLSGKRIPFSAAMPVYTQSNIYKYLPGNVMQYIGRNKLAADMDISHVDVACATILDIVFCVIGTGIVSVVLLGELISGLLGQYGLRILVVGIVGVVVLAAITAALYLKFKDKFKSYISRYAKAFYPENRKNLVQGVLYYFLQNGVSAVMYFISLYLIFDGGASVSKLISYTGAFLFAWIIGFITIGAPGGIGIRESVMLFVCGSQFESKILLFVLAMRFSSIIADILAFVFGRVYLRVRKF